MLMQDPVRKGKKQRMILVPMPMLIVEADKMFLRNPN